ncbi:MAG: DNA recombination protein RmuC [Oscillospiraceae bacterium]|jgi:DNA recombination protein RmuC|nr:DNA recombination protein RmuC [Oscillospiraceae bacterium]
MTIALLAAAIALAAANFILLFIRKPKDHAPELEEIAAGSSREVSELTRLGEEIRRLDALLREEFARGRAEALESGKASREELAQSLKVNREELSLALRETRETVETRLRHIQQDNAKQLEEMRRTVDEKLRESVEKRFDESFKLISERLEQVHRGLGEMQSLASGVGDLKKVLTNVKTRGSLGEIQLGAIFEQILAPEQYERNAAVKQGSQERVEYAVRLPGGDNAPLLLPVDSKFPVEDYQRLLDAYDSNTDVETTSRLFENAVKKNAKEIRAKYINPPVTTDFAIMFVPTEGLYAEILRRPGLFELLQREYRVTVVGPANTAAFLSSLQMGFRTLAIEKRSSEVWELLGAVKTEFGKFGGVLDNIKNKINAAANELDRVGVRSRAIERRLRGVGELETARAEILLGEGDAASKEEAEEF